MPDLLIDLMTSIVSIVLLVGSLLFQPSRAACPQGWYLDKGIQRSGSFECVQKWKRINRPDAYQPPGILDEKIYCTGGTRPIQVQDGRTVGCQRR